MDLFSKYGWIVPALKDEKGEIVTEAFKTIFKEGRKPQYLWTDKGQEYYNKHMKLRNCWKKITYHYTQPKMRKNLMFVKDGSVQSKPRCGSSSLSKATPNISVYYQKYWSSIIILSTVPLK